MLKYFRDVLKQRQQVIMNAYHINSMTSGLETLALMTLILASTRFTLPSTSPVICNFSRVATWMEFGNFYFVSSIVTGDL